MGRRRKRNDRRRRSKYTKDKLKEGISRVEAGENLIKVAKKTKIPRRTLRNHTSGERGQTWSTGGRPTVLLPTEEQSISQHIALLGDYGYAIDRTELKYFVKSFLDKAGRNVEHFKDNMPGKKWVSLFLERHQNLLSNRLCKNINRRRAAVTEQQVKRFLSNLESNKLDSIPPQNIINYDETFISDDPKSKKMLFRRGIKRPERVMNSSKVNFGVMFTGSASGTLLPPYIVYKSEYIMDSWLLGGPENARYNRTKTGWFDGPCFEDWFKYTVIPYFDSLDNNHPRVMIGDNVSTHISASVIELCEKHNILFILLPANSTHLLQPFDIGVFGPMKSAWKKVITDWKRGPGLKHSVLPKTWFPYLLVNLLNAMPNMDYLLKKAFCTTGICPLNKGKLHKIMGHTDAPVEGVAPQVNLISDMFIDHLKKLREESNARPDGRGRGRGRRVTVSPGRSITLQDIQQAGPSGTTKKVTRGPAKKKTKATSPVTSSDDSEDASDDDLYDFIESETVAEDVLLMETLSEDRDFKPEEYVLVKFETKKTVYHHVGNLLNLDRDNDSWTIDLLRRNYVDDSRTLSFVKPNIPDHYVTSINDIAIKLPKPAIVKDKLKFPIYLFGNRIVR